MRVFAVDGSKITNECRTQSNVCGVYSRIITKTRYNVVIYIIQRNTILSQQKHIHDWNLKHLPVLNKYLHVKRTNRHCCERFNKCDFENTCKRRPGINTASKTLRI